jgi:hypothetical protein
MKRQEFVAVVVSLTLGKYRKYLEEAVGEKLSTRTANALREGVRQGFLKAEVAEKLNNMYLAGDSDEVVAQSFFYSTSFTRGVRRAKGLAAFYKKAAMYASVAYACSPESEAYWAS